VQEVEEVQVDEEVLEVVEVQEDVEEDLLEEEEEVTRKNPTTDQATPQVAVDHLQTQAMELLELEISHYLAHIKDHPEHWMLLKESVKQN